MPMPIEIKVTLKNGKETYYYMPLQMMRGSKPAPEGEKWVELEPWAWTNPTYAVDLPIKKNKIKQIEIDPHHMMMDIDRTNDVLVKKKEKS
jgi:hypothetical protein